VEHRILCAISIISLPTSNQFFTESQLESYRHLDEFLVQRVL
jgi:hypothetical protein